MKQVSSIPQAVFGIGFIALIVFALLLLGNGKSHPMSPALPYQESTPIPSPTNTPRPEEEQIKKEIEALKTKIADPTMPPDTKEIVKRRLKIAEYRGTLIAQPPDPSNPHPTVVIPTLDPTKALKYELDDGIVVVPVAYPPESVKIKNVWKGRQGNDKYMVYAGAWKQNPDQGLVIVWQTPKQDPYEATFFPTPGKFGMVEIVGYEGMILQLKSEKGDILNFDVLNGTYLGFPPATPTAIETAIIIHIPTPGPYPYPAP